METMLMQNFGGTEKENYGIFESRLYVVAQKPQGQKHS